MSLVTVLGGKKFTCPADDCQLELEYKLTATDLDRGLGHMHCPGCGLMILFEIKIKTESGEPEIKGPKVLRIA